MTDTHEPSAKFFSGRLMFITPGAKVPNVKMATPDDLGPFWRSRPMNTVRLKTIIANRDRAK